MKRTPIILFLTLLLTLLLRLLQRDDVMCRGQDSVRKPRASTPNDRERRAVISAPQRGPRKAQGRLPR